MSDKHCNIDSRGKAFRLICGLILIVAAGLAAVFIATGRLEGVWALIIAISLFVSGVFALYEGWSGWCALRAMGIKTWL